MRKLFHHAALLGPMLLLAMPACASDKPTALLGIADLDPTRVLPPPPLAGSAQALAELGELHAIEATRTPAEEADARRDGNTKNATIFADVLGARFDLDALPTTSRLMAIVRASEKDVVDRGKDAFKRPRPYVVDPGLKSCKRNDDPLSSYPSGHTTMAFAMGETLARLIPEQAPALLARSARYGQSRILCGQHYRSDVSAGAMLGVLVAERLMAKASFAATFADAHRELVRAGFAQ